MRFFNRKLAYKSLQKWSVAQGSDRPTFLKTLTFFFTFQNGPTKFKTMIGCARLCSAHALGTLSDFLMFRKALRMSKNIGGCARCHACLRSWDLARFLTFRRVLRTSVFQRALYKDPKMGGFLPRHVVGLVVVIEGAGN